MGDEQILKRWMYRGTECLYWQRDASVYRGAITRDGQILANLECLKARGEVAFQSSLEGLARTLVRPTGGWDISAEPITDLAVVPLPGQLGGKDYVALTKPVDLGWDISIVPVSAELRELVEDACDPQGVGTPEGIDLRGRPLYAFLRADAPRRPLYQWDSDERLQLAIALSRLVRPTSVSFRYAVRAIGIVGSTRSEIIPGPVRGFGALAWTAKPDEDWLRESDFAKLKELLQCFLDRPFLKAGRLQQAFWYHEYAARKQLIEVRVPLVATALEALLGTSGDRSTQQFVKRLPQLGALMGLRTLSEARARKMWGLRSKLSHGEARAGLADKDFEVYTEMEECLRLALHRAVISQAFRDVFTTSESVARAFPLPTPSPQAATCPKCLTTFPFQR